MPANALATQSKKHFFPKLFGFFHCNFYLKVFQFCKNYMVHIHCNSDYCNDCKKKSFSSSFQHASVFAELKELLVKVFSGKEDIKFASEEDAPNLVIKVSHSFLHLNT